jgi:4-hydroxy-tetrahydrodipicolinate synthase
MDTSIFRGTTVAMITPFDSEGRVDEATLRRFVDWQIEHGTDVLLACGTTGESATLSHDEHHRVMDIVINQVKKRVPVICGAGSNATTEAISLAKYAEKAGADGILSVGPYYNKPTQEGFFQHFKAIAESVKLPLILYNVPGRTGSNIAAQTTLRLAQVPNIAGIKEASGNLSQIMEIIRARPKDFLVLSGDDALTLPLLALGADGIVSVVANQAPAILHEMVHCAFAGNWAKARELHYRLLPLMEFNFVESNPIPVKSGAAMMGLVEEKFRLPLMPLSAPNKEKMRSILQELDLLK